MKTLGDELPKEVTRVRDELLPLYDSIGPPGKPAATLMRKALDRATKAMVEGNTVAMLGCYEELKGFTE